MNAAGWSLRKKQREKRGGMAFSVYATAEKKRGEAAAAYVSKSEAVLSRKKKRTRKGKRAGWKKGPPASEQAGRPESDWRRRVKMRALRGPGKRGIRNHGEEKSPLMN